MPGPGRATERPEWLLVVGIAPQDGLDLEVLAVALDGEAHALAGLSLPKPLEQLVPAPDLPVVYRQDHVAHLKPRLVCRRRRPHVHDLDAFLHFLDICAEVAAPLGAS